MKNVKSDVVTIAITPEEVKNAETFLFKQAQEDSYGHEMNNLKGPDGDLKKFLVLESSSIRQLRPFIDEDGIMRVSGRLVNATHIPYYARHPVILDSKHPLTVLIINYYH